MTIESAQRENTYSGRNTGIKFPYVLGRQSANRLTRQHAALRSRLKRERWWSRRKGGEPEKKKTQRQTHTHAHTHARSRLISCSHWRDGGPIFANDPNISNGFWRFNYVRLPLLINCEVYREGSWNGGQGGGRGLNRYRKPLLRAAILNLLCIRIGLVSVKAYGNIPQIARVSARFGWPCAFCICENL